MTDKTFEDTVLRVAEPVLIDFGAEWCGPCRALAPVVEELAREYAGRLRVVGVDVGDAVATAQRFGVISIPALIFFKGGKEVRRLQGRQSKATIARAIRDTLG